MRPAAPSAFARLLHGLVVLLATLAAFAFTLAQAQEPERPPRSRPPTLQAAQPVLLEHVAVQAGAVGLQMQTRLELTVRNPNRRELEATLEFPLREAQTLSGFALDVGGVLMPAVPVPKDKGRQVFDDVTRQRVDPALLERSAGNSFKLRIYPLPAGGTRRVVLHVTESLRPDGHGRATWRLPVDFGQRFGSFSAEITLPTAAPVQALGALQGAQVWRDRAETRLQLQRQNWQPREALQLQWQPGQTDTLAVAPFDEERFFMADIAVPALNQPLPAPRRLTLVWDASGSGAQRDHAREFALLQAFFATLPRVNVQLVLARDAAEPARTFDVRGGDWQALRQALQQVAYDGASNPAAWLPQGSGEDLVLLFSDGLANWDSGATVPAGGAVLHALNAAARHDAARLRALAEARGGRYLDLNELSTAQALHALTQAGLRLVDLRAQGAVDLVAASVHPEGGRIGIAGRLNAPATQVQLVLADAQGRRSVRSLEIHAAARLRPLSDDEVPLPAQRWAALKVAQLEGQRALHRAEIRRLGERFRLVTAETSLIVLDNLADYLRHEITPPAGPLRQAYDEQRSLSRVAQAQSRSQHLEDLVRRFEQRQRWWATEFPKGERPRPPASVGAGSREADRRNERASAPLAMAPAPAAPPPPAALAAAAAQRERASLEARKAGTADAGGETEARIRLQPWQPGTPAARRLHEAAPDQRYAVYLDERPSHAQSTAFFMDAAEVFFAQGDTALAVRVLSNLAEMELENRHILRILAYRLQQAGQVALALPLLERVRELAPDEPQSWRDLGLALAGTNEASAQQRALELLWEVAARPWDSRFADIDLIALAELNALAARVPALDTSRFDPRLLKNLPLDLRAVLSWDADDTDIDLWVTDPNGERAYYGHRLTYQGGAMSRDFTGGYGPEEFALRRAKPGRYEVRAQFFGHRQQIVSPHTTLMLWLATGFGTPGQKDQQVVLRLTGAGEQVLVGSFDVAPAP